MQINKYKQLNTQKHSLQRDSRHAGKVLPLQRAANAAAALEKSSMAILLGEY